MLWSDLLPLVTKSLQRTPLPEAIARHILAEFGTAEWLPPERQLATDLGVSRAALREAIKRLENQGLLESRHGVGVRVTRNFNAPMRQLLQHAVPSPSARIRQFAAVRVLLEPAIAGLAALQAKPADIRRLVQSQAELKSATDLNAAVVADLEFHRHLALIGGNQILALMLASIAELEEQARLVSLRRVGLPDAYAQHQQILDAVIAGKAAEAREAMLIHVQAAQNTPPRRATTTRRSRS